MASVVKVSTVMQRAKKDKESKEKEYRYANALFQLGANKLLEAVKADKILLSARDLKELQFIKNLVAVDDLEDSGMHFIKCNACLYNKACSLFKEGEACRFNLSATELVASKDIVKVMVQLLQIEGDRIQRGLLIEKMEGTVDSSVSQEIMQYFEMVTRLKSILSNEESIEIKVNGNGVISKLFGGLIRKQEKLAEKNDILNIDERVIEVEAKTKADSAIGAEPAEEKIHKDEV